MICGAPILFYPCGDRTGGFRVPPNALPAHAILSVPVGAVSVVALSAGARPVTGCRSSRAPATLLALLLLSACGLPDRANPVLFLRDATGAAQEGRLPPPGLDEPTPNLASVPPVPERPDSATRAAILRGLEGARDAAATPLPEGRPDAPVAALAAPGAPPIAATPPGPPRLTRAPSVPWGSTLPARGAPMVPPDLAPARPEPGAPPAAPAPDLFAPDRAAPSQVRPERAAPEGPPPGLSVPPPPPPELLAPSPVAPAPVPPAPVARTQAAPAPAARDPFAPAAAPPPPPSRDLLAP